MDELNKQIQRVNLLIELSQEIIKGYLGYFEREKEFLEKDGEWYYESGTVKKAEILRINMLLRSELVKLDKILKEDK